MTDYNRIKTFCEENSRISSKVVDEFLIYFAAGRNNLELKMNRELNVYRHITKLFQKEWVNMLKAQYLAHKIFNKNGLINSYLNHPELKKLSLEVRRYLELQAMNPWKFSFSIIKEKPAADFYLMEDVFTCKDFLLFSPGTTDTLKTQPAILWFNLIAFNGECWQSYGPIGAYRSFEPDDIFFFATEMNPEIADEDDLMSDLENNPVPYMMLLSGANLPLVAVKNDQVVHVLAEYDIENIDTKTLKDSFKTEYNKGVYRLSLKRWSGNPHFSQAYFDEANKTILLSAMTDRGFTELVKGFNIYGFDFPDDPLIRVNLTMVNTASNILGRNIDLLRYEKLFLKKTSPEVKKNLDKLNLLLQLVLPDINAGREPDIESLAAWAGVDVDTARDLIGEIIKKFDGKFPR